jgi:predicted DNA-binding protein
VVFITRRVYTENEVKMSNKIEQTVCSFRISEEMENKIDQMNEGVFKFANKSTKIKYLIELGLEQLRKERLGL